MPTIDEPKIVEPALESELETTEPVKAIAKITPRQWVTIESLWTSGTVTLVDLANKYGCSISTLTRHFKKKGLIKGVRAEETRGKVEAAVDKEIMTEAKLAAARIKETKEDHYKMASALSRLTWNEILEAKRNGSPLAVAINNLKALDAAMNVLKKAREERYAVLGLDRPDAIDTNEIPELVISELTAEQVQELRARDHTEVDDAPTVQEGDEDSPMGDIVIEGQQQ